MKDLQKYVKISKYGIYTFDFLLKVFMTANVWKIIVYQEAKVPLLALRRNCFKAKDENGFKDCLRKMSEWS